MNVQAPRFLQIEPVGQCNLRCTMCALQFREDGPPYGPPAFLDYGLFLKLLDEAHDARELQLQGLGEPLMHPRFFDMVREAKRRGLEVSTNSNATLLTEKRAHKLIESGLDRLHVSIDGASAETYERIRIRGHFDRVVANAQRMNEIRRAEPSTALQVHMVAVLMRQNLAELPALVRLAHDLGMDSLFVQHLAHEFEEAALPAQYASMRQFVDEQMLQVSDEAAAEHWFTAARFEAQRLGLPLRLPEPFAVPNIAPLSAGNHRCNWPWTGAYLSYEGLAMPCCMVGTPDRTTLGDTRRDSLIEVWEGDAYRDFRDRLDSDDPPDICRSCAVYKGRF
jgi:MoaA/NifB/PqqE/SkfB family radical SAM enzyme